MLPQPLYNLLQALFFLLLVLQLLLLGSAPSLEESCLPNPNYDPQILFLRPCSELLVYIDLQLVGMFQQPLYNLLQSFFFLLLVPQLLLLGNLPSLEETFPRCPNYAPQILFLQNVFQLIISTDLQLVGMLPQPLYNLLQALFFLPFLLQLLLLGSLH